MMKVLRKMKRVVLVLLVLQSVAGAVFAQCEEGEDPVFDPFACGENPDEEVPLDSEVYVLVAAGICMSVYLIRKAKPEQDTLS